MSNISLLDKQVPYLYNIYDVTAEWYQDDHHSILILPDRFSSWNSFFEQSARDRFTMCKALAYMRRSQSPKLIGQCFYFEFILFLQETHQPR